MSNNGYEDIIIVDSHRKMREAVINYVKRNPECDKQEVAGYCDSKEIGSRAPILEVINELVEENILSMKKVGKSHTLTVNSFNLLIIIPEDLEEIFIQFKNFIDTVKKIHVEKPEINYRQKNPLRTEIINFEKIRTSVPSLPYKVIEIVNDIYIFYLVFILPKKIDKQNAIYKLYLYYFETLTKMYSHISKEFHGIVRDYDLPTLRASDLYRTYMESKRENTFSKVTALVKTCRILGIEDKLYELLDLLWIKNQESVPFVYDLITLKEYYVVIENKLNVNYKDFINDNYVIKQMHLSIDEWIFTLEGCTEEDRSYFY